ncbi:hypothetical protein C8R47DRAFT_1314491, partial [Mycena vitilis]
MTGIAAYAGWAIFGTVRRSGWKHGGWKTGSRPRMPKVVELNLTHVLLYLWILHVIFVQLISPEIYVIVMRSMLHEFLSRSGSIDVHAFDLL